MPNKEFLKRPASIKLTAAQQAEMNKGAREQQDKWPKWKKITEGIIQGLIPIGDDTLEEGQRPWDARKVSRMGTELLISSLLANKLRSLGDAPKRILTNKQPTFIPKPNLPPEFTAVGDEMKYMRPIYNDPRTAVMDKMIKNLPLNR